jgi:hypothetical protein
MKTQSLRYDLQKSDALKYKHVLIITLVHGVLDFRVKSECLEMQSKIL